MTYDVPEYGTVENVGDALTSSLVFAVKRGLDAITSGDYSINYEYFDFGRYEVEALLTHSLQEVPVDVSAIYSNEVITISLFEKSKQFSVHDPFSAMSTWIVTAYEEHLNETNEPVIW